MRAERTELLEHDIRKFIDTENSLTDWAYPEDDLIESDITKVKCNKCGTLIVTGDTTMVTTLSLKSYLTNNAMLQRCKYERNFAG